MTAVVADEIYQGSNMIAYAEGLVDNLDDSDIENATITLNCYDENAADALVSGPLDVSNGGSGKNYYAIIPLADTTAMPLNHLIRLEWVINGGTDRVQREFTWARVVVKSS